MTSVDPFVLAEDLIDLGGFNFIARAALADALIRAGYLTPAGFVPGRGLLGGFRED